MPKETGAEPAEGQPDSKEQQTLSLVDLFDQMDREVFKRVLENHDRNDPVTPST